MPTLVRSVLLSHRPPKAAPFPSVSNWLLKAWRHGAVMALTLAMLSIVVLFGAAVILRPGSQATPAHLAAGTAPSATPFSALGRVA